MGNVIYINKQFIRKKRITKALKKQKVLILAAIGINIVLLLFLLTLKAFL